MASQLFDPFIKTALAPGNSGNGHGGASIDLLGGTGGSVIKGIFVDSAYSVDDEDEFYDDILSTAIVQANGGGDQTFTLAGQSFINTTGGGVAWDANDLTSGTQITGVGDGTDDIDAIILYDDQGATAGLDPVICYIDTGTGFGLTPNNSTIEITWDSAGIFSIGFA